ncbi:hypothetical protein RB628_37275 [Streptomyces sp. ADMS]|uniref:hypothetical protein n=1 Tax=Streptomyces sp. ADMS TaxID=3071415 RepID=UPI00296F0D89|nr:hypothetical protein [Streptomyces sp. ADMS]MDW4910822.1 hypothetical protein [Streptomyces sp. ADMS]
MGNEHGKDFEAQVRELMAEDAYTIRPSAAPYPTIRRRGAIERRRRVAAAGAVLIALVAAPVGAYALNGDGGGKGVDTAAPLPSVSASQGTAPTPVQSAPVGPAGPATPGQLLDGITLARASDGLAKCLAWDREKQRDTTPRTRTDLGDATDYRIILALNSTGDSNAPGDGFHVVAVKEQPQLTRLICNVKDGESSGLNISSGGLELDNGGPVMPDMNGGKLHQQSFIDKGNWKLPFRWGSIGQVDSSVTRVTVSYGDSTSEAALDHGWFVASGTLNQQVTLAPHVKGYDNTGKVVYDSDSDAMYEKTLP